MKKIILILSLILVTSCSGIFKSKPEYLFVQNAKAASFDGKNLKLTNVRKHTIIFSDRPYRISGHVANQEFAKMWYNKKDKDSFRKDSPNAAISYYDKDGKPDVAVVEISDFKVNGNSISYEVKILEGKLPKIATEITLFIDMSAGQGGGSLLPSAQGGDA